MRSLVLILLLAISAADRILVTHAGVKRVILADLTAIDFLLILRNWNGTQWVSAQSLNAISF